MRTYPRRVVRPESPTAKRYIPFWLFRLGGPLMPQLTHRLPKYRKHKISGQAVVTVDGKDVYLWPYGTQASRDQYDRAIKEYIANGRRRARDAEAARPVVAQVG